MRSSRESSSIPVVESLIANVRPGAELVRGDIAERAVAPRVIGEGVVFIGVAGLREPGGAGLEDIVVLTHHCQWLRHQT
jgi:hypothetical protein